MRPRQWVKNLLVLAAPAASGTLLDTDVLRGAGIAFLAFCLVSSGVYLLNDVIDVEEDRAHPSKQHRPIAAGHVSPRSALAAAVVLMTLALAIAVLANPSLVAVISVYAVVNIGYCLALKNEPVIDVAIIASGFVLRAVAGGVAAGIELSQWFILIATFGSLYMAAGKRYAEVRQLGEGESATRKSLARYTSTYLRFVWSVSAALLIMSYALWAFQLGATSEAAGLWSEISMAPFILAVLRYAVDVDAGRASEPEEIALSDRTLQVMAVAWAACLLVAVYLA
jgi:decaprenyl-phosphate phosphoribosyltransferase